MKKAICLMWEINIKKIFYKLMIKRIESLLTIHSNASEAHLNLRSEYKSGRRQTSSN